MEQKKPTQIAELGKFGLIDRLTDTFSLHNRTTLRGVGDDAAVIAASRSEAMLVSTDLLLEGIDFDLTYFPLKHLGYKAVTVGASDILAMNALPEQLLLSLGVSSKFSVEALQEFYEGVRLACEELKIDLAGGDTTASLTGLAVNITTVGRAKRGDIVYRNGAKPNDLICITGNLGAAYMGLQLLEREKRVLRDVENPEPQFAGYEYLLEKYLKPRARRDVVAALAEEKLRPTAMIDLSDGLASDLHTFPTRRSSDLAALQSLGLRCAHLSGAYSDRPTDASAGRRDAHRSGRGGPQRRTGPRTALHRAAGNAGAGDAAGAGRRDRTHHRAGHGMLHGYTRRQRHTPQSPRIQRRELTVIFKTRIGSGATPLPISFGVEPQVQPL